MVDRKALPPIIRWTIRERVVMSVIVLNAVALFLDAFPDVHAATAGVLGWVDYACLLFFVVEAAFKINVSGFHGYLQSGWNRLDFAVVVASLPLLVGPFVAADVQEFAVLMLFRLGRLLRFSRLMRFVPDAAEIMRGILRALRASVAVFLVLFVLNLIFAMGANLLFGHLAPEYFGDPLRAFYSLFKVFTIEGWYDIPDAVAAQGGSPYQLVALRLYFISAVLVGGILGLSLANAVFVDEMIADNTREVERMVTELRGEVQQFREEWRREHGAKEP